MIYTFNKLKQVALKTTGQEQFCKGRGEGKWSKISSDENAGTLSKFLAREES